MSKLEMLKDLINPLEALSLLFVLCLRSTILPPISYFPNRLSCTFMENMGWPGENLGPLKVILVITYDYLVCSFIYLLLSQCLEKMMSSYWHQNKEKFQSSTALT